MTTLQKPNTFMQGATEFMIALARATWKATKLLAIVLWRITVLLENITLKLMSSTFKLIVAILSSGSPPSSVGVTTGTREEGGEMNSWR